MSTQAGIVQFIGNGKFLVKDQNGNINELKVGDIIFEDHTVYGVDSNSSSAKIEILLDGNDVIVLSEGQKQLIDNSLVETAFGNEELYFTREDIENILDAHNDISDVWSSLRDANFDGFLDITEEETTAGEEEEEIEEGSIGTFANRDGQIVDVVSDLRKKSWVKTQTYKEVEKGDEYDSLNSKPLGNNPVDRPITTPGENVTPPTVTPPTVTPPTSIPPANLSINDVTMYEQDGYMVFTVTLDKPANGNISVNFATSNVSAEAGKDYIHTTGVITIPSGSNTAQIKVPIKDDYFYENKETFNVTLTNPTGNVNIVKSEGIGTILDNPPTTEKTPTTNNTPDSGTGTYDSGDTVYVKLVNSDTVKEGIYGATDLNNSTLKHYIQLVDKDGKPVEIPAGKSISIELEYKDILGSITENDFKDGGDFKNKVTITIDANSPKENGIYKIDIKNPAIFDNILEDLEIYELSIKTITQNGNPFENVVKHPIENTVTGAIYDTVPDDVKIETKEDTQKDLTILNNIKDMFVDNGKGFVKVPKNGEVILYDNDRPIGTITYDKDNSKFTFKPYDDYSDYTKSGDVKFLYYAVNHDNSTEFKNVTVTVTPVADTPTITVKDVTTYEDNKNTQEGQHKIALGLIVPSLSKDQIDKNGANGDHPERNGEITLTFTNGLSVTGAKIFNGSTEVATINSAGQELKVVIVKTSGGTDIDTSYHHSGTLPTKGGNVLYLTKAEYEALKIQHAEDNDTDIKIAIKVTSYELDDDNKPLIGEDEYKSEISADMTVNILPVTDNISIKWDNNSKGTISNADKTYTFTSVDKQKDTVLNIKNILSPTSGALNGDGGTKGDLDGSEKRAYEITGLPKGTVVTIGTGSNKQEATVGADGKATIVFNDANNKNADPDFSIKFPEYYAGTVNGTITLKVQDKGVEESSDSSKWGDVKTDSVNFKINVNPVVISDPSNQTIQIAQAIGNEDAGRENNNKLNTTGGAVSSSGNITDPTKGLKLNIEPKGSDLVVKGETATIFIDKVPVGGSLYIYDNSTKNYKLIGVENGQVIEYTKNGSEWTTKTVLTDGKTGNISVSLNGDGTYKVEILDYQNSKLPTFIPPHNDDKDYTFKVSGEKVSSAIIDGQTIISKEPYNSGNPLDMSVIVKNIADEPINTELVDSDDKIVTIGGTKYIKATEDEVFYLKDIYKNTPSSYDDDGSEVLSIKITLPFGVTMVDGATYRVYGNEYVIKSTDLDNIKLQFDKNFSGTLNDIKLKYITTEQSGENSSKTHFEQTVKLFVNPVAEAEIKKSTIGNEDSIFKVDFDIAYRNGDNDETLESIMIKASDITSKDFTLYIGNGEDKVVVTTLIPNIDGYYELTKAQCENIYAKNTTEHTHGDYKFDVKYIVKDTANGISDTKISNFDYELNIKAVTDKPTLNVGEITTENTSKVAITHKTVTIKEPDAEFKVPLTTTSDDKDGSETVQEIVISGVPQGVEVIGATYYGYNGSPHNGIWVIKNPTDKVLDSNGAKSEITFKVNPGSNFEDRDIKITTYTKDSGDAEVKSDSQTIKIEKGDDYTPGTGTGTPPLFNLSTQLTTIYEDNDSDPKTDGNQDEYNLGKSIVVTAENGHPDNGNYAITITDFPNGTTITGYDYSYKETVSGVEKTFYVVVGNGNAADAMTKLSNVIVTPPKDMNTGGDIDGKMTFSATISTYDGGTFKEGTAINNHENDITPVTDKMTIIITADNINEDGTSTININLSNPSDGSKTELGDTINITIIETWKDIVDGGGMNGIFTVPAGYTISSTSTDLNGNIVYSIKKNDNSSFSVGDINGLTYKSANNRDGEVKFEVSVQNKETGSTVTLDSKGDKTIIVTPVIDTNLDASTVIATGIEDLAIAGLANPIKVTITDGANPLVITDKSETLGNIVLDKIPNGMTVWYMDGGTLKMATNIGTSTGSYSLNPNGDKVDVGVNKWLIPTNGSNTIPEIYVNAPENWAGTFNFNVNLSIYEQNLSTPIEKTINSTGKIEAVADGFESISGTKATKNIFQWTDLQLNANMKDIDGSEVMNLELTGLSSNAQFKLKDGSLTNTAVWDGSKWTISGVKVSDINKIQFMDTKATTSVTAKAWTQELDESGNPLTGTNYESNKVDISENLAEIKAISGKFTFDKELSLDFNNIGDIKTGETYNIGLKDITTIDLGSKNGANELLNLTLQDVLDMGKEENGEINITILGGGDGTSKDKVTFADHTQWLKSSEITNGYYEYTNTTDSTVKVKVQQEIEQPL